MSKKDNDAREFKRVILKLAQDGYITLTPTQDGIANMTPLGLRAASVFMHLIEKYRDRAELLERARQGLWLPDGSPRIMPN